MSPAMRSSGVGRDRVGRRVIAERVVAVDWSGDRSAAGQRRKIWAGVWTAGASVRLENKKTRLELIDWLVGLAGETPQMVVGVDFCFSYPAWFVKEQRARTASVFWEIVARRGEEWLSSGCADARFWGRKGTLRDGKVPVEFQGAGKEQMFRLADLACKVQGRILDPTEAAKVKGIAPKSPFQIGGAGAVGTGTLRGIPILSRLVNAGFSIWPFDATRLPMVVEIYPRLLTGAVKKTNAGERTKYLKRKQQEEAAYASLEEEVLAKARRSEDAFDALVSVMEMAARRDDFSKLKQTTDPRTLLEGSVWGAGVCRAGDTAGPGV